MLKGMGWDIFNFVNFEKIFYMKLYNLLILTINIKKSKNNFKAPKKSEIVIFPDCILPCKQNKSAIQWNLLSTATLNVSQKWPLEGVGRLWEIRGRGERGLKKKKIIKKKN